MTVGRWLQVFLMACGLLGLIGLAPRPAPQAPCHAQGPLPDPVCTPGAVDPTRTVDLVCSTSTRTVRPPVEVTQRIKAERMAAYGDTDDPRNYELDHLIPLELGGDPASVLNLWPQPYTGLWSAHVKDRLENALHRLVCDGSVPLAQAQHDIRLDWVAAYETYVSH